MWVVRAKRNIVGNVITLVLLSILAGIVGGGLVGIATRSKPSTAVPSQPS